MALWNNIKLNVWLVRGFAFQPIVVPLSFPWLFQFLPHGLIVSLKVNSRTHKKLSQ
ncbi:hypothetical protein L873DRAFT_1800799 [Choiromyces venosus 120613-1]|uniref:Uncharacterized protein n=1 Tax=Choiromyces venosus 120613-1 TaxID=1336337 RepID=A0A3N4JY74_9PEZI|nr:hypothetical protein L873DRAFT_1800799 [Choiromyces venosus 120613-1]